MPSANARVSAAIRGTRSSRSYGWRIMSGPSAAATERSRELHLARLDAGGAQVSERTRRRREAAARGAHQIVRRLETVDAHARAREPRMRECAHDREEAGMQIRLAADDRDLARAHRCELPDDVERRLGVELRFARVAGARSAVGTRLIATERELPDDVRGMRIVLGGDGAVGPLDERELDAAARGHRFDASMQARFRCICEPPCANHARARCDRCATRSRDEAPSRVGSDPRPGIGLVEGSRRRRCACACVRAARRRCVDRSGTDRDAGRRPHDERDAARAARRRVGRSARAADALALRGNGASTSRPMRAGRPAPPRCRRSRSRRSCSTKAAFMRGALPRASRLSRRARARRRSPRTARSSTPRCSRRARPVTRRHATRRPGSARHRLPPAPPFRHRSRGGARIEGCSRRVRPYADRGWGGHSSRLSCWPAR